MDELDAEYSDLFLDGYLDLIKFGISNDYVLRGKESSEYSVNELLHINRRFKEYFQKQKDIIQQLPSFDMAKGDS